MQSHFLIPRKIASRPSTMRSHFLISRRAAAACAVASAAALLSGSASAQTPIAADSATNPTYAGGWSAGQNGGYGFGPWSFDSTGNAGQEITSSSAVGTAWTLFNMLNAGGISEAGRAITEPGGLQVGQTFQATMQNPTSYHYYRGFDVLFYNGSDNLPGGDNTAALRLVAFDYHNVGSVFWNVTDANGSPGTFTVPSFTDATTGAAGFQLALTLTTATNYSLTLTPLDGESPYTLTGPLALTATDSTNLPINFVNFRCWHNASTGPNDTVDNFEISNMSINWMGLNIQAAGTNVVLSWLATAPAFNLVTSTNPAAPGPSWTPVLTTPVVVDGQNFVTNPISGTRRYFRLKK